MKEQTVTNLTKHTRHVCFIHVDSIIRAGLKYVGALG